MRALVTGGSGFIGSNLVKKLKEENIETVIIDKILNFDIRDYQRTKDYYKNIDVVFHLAAETSIQKSLEYSDEVFHTNISGTHTVLRCSVEAGVKKVILSSTSAVYGNSMAPSVESQKEKCLNPYSISKLAAEHLCGMFSNLYGIETIILRYFNVYGPGQSSSGQYAPVIGKFLNQKNNNEPITIFGTGNQVRDFIYVEDVVNANIFAAKSTRKFFAEIFNVGTGTGYSIKELANLISDNIVFLPKRDAEIEVSIANSYKLKNILNYVPKITVKDWIVKNEIF